MLYRFLCPIATLVMAISFQIPWAQGAGTEPQGGARMMVHLLGYLAKDYGGAVSNGVVKSQSEYAEQVEFVTDVVNTGKATDSVKDQPALMNDLRELREMILAKAPAETVAPKAKLLQAAVVKVSQLSVSPDQWPKASAVAEIFSKSCGGCHGATGRGDGPDGTKLDPKPANFISSETMASATPLSLFNTIRLGVPGTAMRPFVELSDDQAWALAFYAQSIALRFPQPGAEAVVGNPSEAERGLKLGGLTLADIATSTDFFLMQRLVGAGNQSTSLVQQLRVYEGPQNGNMAVGATTGGSILPRDGSMAKALLQDALEAFRSGQFDNAKQLSLRAYIEGFEPLEPRLRALDPALLQTVEVQMADVRRAIDRRVELGVLQQAIEVASQSLNKVSSLVGEGQSLSPTLAFSASSAIILREGFEAVLVVIALLSVIRAAGAPVAALYVHGGWLGALFLGFGLWFLSGWLMDLSGAGREALEGFTSILAVAILLVVGFWLHSQTEIGRWKRFLNGKVRDALQGGRLWTLASISFIAVFREAVETVLFVRAIWIDSGVEARWALISGVIVALAAVILLSWLILRFSIGIPVRAMFSVSSFVMAVLAMVLTGKGLHALQETGLVSETGAKSLPRFDWFGVFPTWETVISQILMLMIVLALWYFGRRPSNGDPVTQS